MIMKMIIFILLIVYILILFINDIFWFSQLYIYILKYKIKQFKYEKLTKKGLELIEFEQISKQK